MTMPNMPDGSLVLNVSLTTSPRVTAGKVILARPAAAVFLDEDVDQALLEGLEHRVLVAVIGQRDRVVIVEAALRRNVLGPVVRIAPEGQRCRRASPSPAGRDRCRSSASASTCRRSRRRSRASAGSATGRGSAAVRGPARLKVKRTPRSPTFSTLAILLCVTAVARIAPCRASSSNVKITSSGVTGLPSENFARSSRVNSTKLRWSSVSIDLGEQRIEGERLVGRAHHQRLEDVVAEDQVDDCRARRCPAR